MQIDMYTPEIGVVLQTVEKSGIQHYILQWDVDQLPFWKVFEGISISVTALLRQFLVGTSVHDPVMISTHMMENAFPLPL